MWQSKPFGSGAHPLFSLKRPLCATSVECSAVLKRKLLLAQEVRSRLPLHLAGSIFADVVYCVFSLCSPVWRKKNVSASAQGVGSGVRLNPWAWFVPEWSPACWSSAPWRRRPCGTDARPLGSRSAAAGTPGMQRHVQDASFWPQKWLQK